MGLGCPECYSACLEGSRFWIQYPEVHKPMIHKAHSSLCKEFVSDRRLTIVQRTKTHIGTLEYTRLD